MKRCLLAIGLVLMAFAPAKALEAVAHHTLFYDYGKGSWYGYSDWYWQINASSVNFLPTGKDSFKVGFVATLEIQSAHGKQIKRDTFYTLPYATAEEAQRQLIAHQISVRHDLGINVAKLTLRPLYDTTDTYSYTDSFMVEVPMQPIFLSGLQVVDTIAKLPYNGPFAKNGVFHFPRPYLFFDSTQKTLRLYSELYAQDALPKKVLVKSYLSRQLYGAPAIGSASYDTVQMWRRAMHSVSINAAYLPSGNYYLCQEVFDTSKANLDRKYLFVQLYNPKPKRMEEDTTKKEVLPVYLDLSTTFVKKYNLAQLKAILKMMKLIASDLEIATINALGLRPDDLTIRNFIYNFWLSRNPTAPDKAWEEYADKIKFINKEFGSSSHPGYESEQGSIYIRFGKPNDVIRVNNEAGAYPYEIWQYYAAGSTGREGVFLFYQPGNALGQYVLLHSTVRGERRNVAWMQMLYPGGAPANSFSSKAMQYIGNK